jgi:hypothetical protein
MNHIRSKEDCCVRPASDQDEFAYLKYIRRWPDAAAGAVPQENAFITRHCTNLVSIESVHQVLIRRRIGKKLMQAEG